MATYVETDSVGVCVDPGVSLAPKRYGLPPHPVELEREKVCWNAIKGHSQSADILVVTHYHYDHHNPEEPEIYRGKDVYIKHPTKMINRSQENRAAYFLSKLEKIPKSIEFADGRDFKVGDTTIRFSNPVYHGTNPRLGYVIEVLISEGSERFIYTSDVEGPTVPEQASFITEGDPQTLLVDGPMTYMLGFRYSQRSLELANRNLVGFIENTCVSKLVIEHHFMRDLNYRSRIIPVYEAAEERGIEVISAAEYVRRPIDLLEARRRELYEKYPR